MVRLGDLSEYEREHLMIKDVGPIGPDVWVQNSEPLSTKRIALITTAGLHFRDDIDPNDRRLLRRCQVLSRAEEVHHDP